VSVEDTHSQVLDTEMRDLTIPDLTGPSALLGTPTVFRARTLRDYQQLKTDPKPVPVATREFSRTDRVLIRVPAYGPGDASKLVVKLLNRAGQPMSDVPSTGAPTTGEQQIDLPLAGLAPGEYVLQIKATADGGEAKEELVAFRVSG
jgi:hypothetical protein